MFDCWPNLLKRIVLLGAMLLLGCSTPEPLTIADATVRMPVPGQDKTVGYFTLQNNASVPMELVAVRSPQIRAIEMHTTEERDGMLRMRRLGAIPVAAGERVHFVTGGKHLMLFGTAALDTVPPPEAVEMVLEFADGTELSVAFRVTPLGGG